ncbi:molybdopterin synthase sulfur carrier subunit [Mycobacterium sp. 852013-51886_SCH5428379]|uniref:MoaD/ThiS family protein n=1 Tax=Mycobacterium sp. 852013-51886_SCH5428379 TaxID=1834111 RepID=UPI0007FDA2AF|nr:MoaD/ThiS family protein [Mycobacterium sp. 852013-51886_SCH5428379]OBB61947.1 molybdopterin synthase sulfur carrier subunit [Mycobacterium sp. 852013-51886_SCH5428379]
MTSATTVRVTVRFFAAARAAADAESIDLELAPDTTVAQVVSELSGRSTDLARVLARCSYLCDGVAVRDQAMTLQNAQTLDVLPPFAGG